MIRKKAVCGASKKSAVLSKSHKKTCTRGAACVRIERRGRGAAAAASALSKKSCRAARHVLLLLQQSDAAAADAAGHVGMRMWRSKERVRTHRDPSRERRWRLGRRWARRFGRSKQRAAHRERLGCQGRDRFTDIFE